MVGTLQYSSSKRDPTKEIERKVMLGVGIIALTLPKDNAYRQAAMVAGAGDVVREAELISELLPFIRRLMQV